MDESKINEESKPLSGHLETFISIQSISKEMFGDSRELTQEEYSILQKTLRKCLSKEPTRLPRKP